MMAILEDALTTVRKLARVAPIGRAPRALIAERAWFDSEDRSWPFSFRNVCDALDLDVEAVRRMVDRATEGT